MTSTLLPGLRTLAATLTAVLLVACGGSAPVVRSQQTGVVNPAKMTRILFFYQEANLASRQTAGKGDVTVSVGETGFYQFGEAMVARAPPAFQKTGISVVHAAVIPPGEWKQVAPKTFGELGPAALKGATVITVMPRGGRARATPNAATVAMTFEVRAIDAASAKVIWSGVVDTSTWNGRDFLTKNVQGSRFDQAYADQFLEAVITTLRTNGLL